MSATTVNAFPPLHAFSSSRSWFLALIVLVHVGFFYALTSGLTVKILESVPHGKVVWIPTTPRVLPPRQPVDVHPVVDRIYVPVIDTPQLPPEDSHPPVVTSGDPQPPPPVVVKEAPGSGPLIVEPRTDPRFPFTQPPYPGSEIRLGHEGTVLLRVQILPNGRVGEIEIEESSGFVKLDESAAREARSYRMKPGMQNGVATVMWVRVPVKFQLKN